MPVVLAGMTGLDVFSLLNKFASFNIAIHGIWFQAVHAGMTGLDVFS
jgi:hypothetical protein